MGKAAVIILFDPLSNINLIGIPTKTSLGEN